jgi:low affinity Fe/Cu permease
MVFLIQNTQNRDAKTVNLKLDELIKAAKSASNNMLDLDGLTDKQLAELEEQFRLLAHKRPSKLVIEQKETVEME